MTNDNKRKCHGNPSSSSCTLELTRQLAVRQTEKLESISVWISAS